jgi:hypothetical protein
MVLAYMQRTARSGYSAGGHSTFLRVAQPLVILQLRSVYALHADGSQDIFRETQTYQADYGSISAMVRPS